DAFFIRLEWAPPRVARVAGALWSAARIAALVFSILARPPTAKPKWESGGPRPTPKSRLPGGRFAPFSRPPLDAGGRPAGRLDPRRRKARITRHRAGDFPEFRTACPGLRDRPCGCRRQVPGPLAGRRGAPGRLRFVLVGPSGGARRRPGRRPGE